MVETESDEILRNADKENISLLVVGDPFGYVTFLVRPPNFLAAESRSARTVPQHTQISSSAPVISTSPLKSFTMPQS